MWERVLELGVEQRGQGRGSLPKRVSVVHTYNQVLRMEVSMHGLQQCERDCMLFMAFVICWWVLCWCKSLVSLSVRSWWRLMWCRCCVWVEARVGCSLGSLERICMAEFWCVVGGYCMERMDEVVAIAECKL